jgi:hypothetical protein
LVVVDIDQGVAAFRHAGTGGDRLQVRHRRRTWNMGHISTGVMTGNGNSAARAVLNTFESPIDVSSASRPAS